MTSAETPDFDKMSPEEIMRWMETLAKRQGASEGLMTNADAQIAEINPDEVVLDEPGYVPYGKDPKKWAEEEAARKAAAAASRPAPAAPPPVMTPPAAAAPPPMMTPPAAAAPPPAETVKMPEPLPFEQPAAPVSAMSWLESLAADQGADFSGLDFSSLTVEPPPAPAEPAGGVNPMDWLESLTQDQSLPAPAAPPPAAPVRSGPADPFAAGVDPMDWLESLAKRQGAQGEELMTAADMDVPQPESAAVDGPGYVPYSFDTVGMTAKPPDESATAESVFATSASIEPSEMEDPAAWLDSLASSQGFAADTRRSVEPPADDSLKDVDIQEALARGEVIPHDQMAAWMSRQLEIGAQRPEPEPEYDPDAPAVPAEIPDWLIEQVGAPVPPPAPIAPAVPERPPLSEIIAEPPAVADMPDWLREDLQPQSELDSIFDMTPSAVEAAPPVAESRAVLEVDTSDPWVEALDNELEEDAIPEWYVRNINDPARIAEVNRKLGLEAPEPEPSAPQFQDMPLAPETQLQPGEPQDVPDWLREMVGTEEAAAVVEEMPDWLTAEVSEPVSPDAVEVPAVTSDMPDWLKAVGAEEPIPDWLTETISDTQSQAVEPPPVVAAPPPVPVPAAPPAPVPAAPAAAVDAAATLAAARAAASSDLDSSLRHYETLIRANQTLEAVVADLDRLAERYKTNAAVFRVLGDGLMRQGKLQAALDTYRKALNQL